MNASNASRFTAVCALILCLSAGMAAAVPVLDQQTSGIAASQINAGNPSLTWQQEVTVGITGVLSSVELYVYEWQLGTTPFSINVGTPWQSDASDFSGLFTANAGGWTAIDVSSAILSFNAGDHFVFEVGGVAGGPGLKFSGDPYAGGQLWWNFVGLGPAEWNNGVGDIAFKTYMEPANVPAVPAPAAVVLTLLGAGLVGYLRTRRTL